jgi:hypothetical protein
VGFGMTQADGWGRSHSQASGRLFLAD